MENNDQRILAIQQLSQGISFFSKASTILNESIEDLGISPEEHKRLFTSYTEQVMGMYPNLSSLATENAMYRHACMTKGYKERATTQTLREQLQSQIDTGNIQDMTGKIKPETLWGIICIQNPQFKEKHQLDEVFNKNDTNLFAAIVATSSGLAIHSQRTAHLRH